MCVCVDIIIKQCLTCVFLFYFLQIKNFLTPLEIMASLIAAVAHDLDHPGVNQPFLIATSNHLATLYEVNIDNDVVNHKLFYIYIYIAHILNILLASNTSFVLS